MFNALFGITVGWEYLSQDFLRRAAAPLYDQLPSSHDPVRANQEAGHPPVTICTRLQTNARRVRDGGQLLFCVKQVGCRTPAVTSNTTRTWAAAGEVRKHWSWRMQRCLLGITNIDCVDVCVRGMGDSDMCVPDAGWKRLSWTSVPDQSR